MSIRTWLRTYASPRRSVRRAQRNATRMMVEHLEDRSVPTVVSPGAMNGWSFLVRDSVGALGGNPTGAGSFVSGPASPPAGTGSFNLATGNGATGGDASAEFRNGTYATTPLSSLTALSYSTYATSWNGQQLPYMALEIDFTGDLTPDDRIFFEPAFQNPVDGNPLLPDQGAAALNTWQTWNALTGGWWSNNSIAGADPGTNVKSLADYLVAQPTARIVNTLSGLGGVQLRVGFASANDVFNGYVDNVTIATGSSTNFDFENVAPSVVYVNSSWAGLNPGVDPDGAGPATVFGGDAFATIQQGITAVASGGTVNVSSGSYSENLTLNKPISLRGAQFGVDARGRVATETTITAASGTLLTLTTGSASTTIDGFTFNGAVRGIESSSGPLNNLQISNNRFTGFTGNGIFLNDSGTDITIDKNVVDGTFKTGGGALVHLDTDNFNGFHLTNNHILNGVTGTGFFVDGNHNVGPSGARNPLINGNLIQNNQTGMNLGTRAFGSQFTPNAGTISSNTFNANLFDGLQGGMQNVAITMNTFSNNGRSGLALTSFGNTGTDRGAQNSTVSQNVFSGNGADDLLFSATQAVGTISTNKAFNNSFSSPQTITYTGTETIDVSRNWFGSTQLTTIFPSISSEIQTVTVKAGVTSGQFSLTFGAETTAPLDYNATATDIQNALIALTAFAPGDVVVVGPGTPGLAYTIHYLGAYAHTNVALITANDISLAGATAPQISTATNRDGVVSPTVDFTPYLNSGTDTDLLTAGFQGDFSSVTVHTTGVQSGSTGRIQEGVDAATSTGTVTVLGGSYTGAVDVNKPVTLAPAGAGTGIVSNGAGVSFTASGAFVAATINGTTVDTQYDQLASTGTVDLGTSKVSLSLNGSFVPVNGDVFTIVSAASVTGEFAGLANNALIGFNGRTLRVNYTPTTVTLTAVSPATVSINRSGSTPTNAASVSWTVTFSSPVGGVASGNFTLIDGSSSLTGELISSVTAVAPDGFGRSATWTVTAGTGTGDGTLGLNMTSNAGITDGVGSPLVSSVPVVGEVYTIDKTQAALTALKPIVTGGAVVNVNLMALAMNSKLPWQIIGFQAEFSENVTGVALSSLTGVSATSITVVNGTTVQFGVATITNGTFTVGISGTGIADLAGNAGLSGTLSNTLSTKYGDVNGSGTVNNADLNAIRNSYLNGLPYNPFLDLNGDGIVDREDYNIARGRIGT